MPILTKNGAILTSNGAILTISSSGSGTINNQNKTVYPLSTQQLITASSDYSGLGTVTVKAVTHTATQPKIAYGQTLLIGDADNSSRILSLSGTFTQRNTVSSGQTAAGAGQILNGYSAWVDGAEVQGNISTMTLPTSASSTATSGYTSKATISASSSVRYINIPPGYNSSGVYYTLSAASGGTTINNKPSQTIAPTESQQTIGYDSPYTGLEEVVISAISSTYVGSGISRKSSTDLTVSGATITAPAGYYAASASKSVSTMTLPTAASSTSSGTSKATISRSTSDQYINIPTGYNSTASYYKINAVSNMTLPTATSATSSGTSKVTIGRSTSNQYINIPVGYNDTAAYYTISAVANGSATGPTSITQSSATVSTGTNTLTLTKQNVTTTPTVTAGYVSSATASTATVSLTASVTTKAAATYYPSTSDQTISASQYLTGAQTIKAVTTTNLIAANIKKNVVIEVGDTNDSDRILSITGSYEGSGSGNNLQVETATTTPSSASSSISFTGLSGEPTSFVVTSMSDLATGSSPWKTASVVYDGTNVIGQVITNTSNAQVTYDSSGFSKSYSNGTLTITGTSTNFQANQYKLVYTYGGSSGNIGTDDVQVGSGATSITFTGLSDEPSYFSCIFKSNFSTSSGYQRVITVVYDGTSTYGLAMDSSAKDATNWSYTYNNGSLTISSSGTNAGGYFHQPGYYQLTYATGEVIELTAEPLSVTENGTYTAPKGKAYTPVTVSVSGSGSSKNVQIGQNTSRTTATSLTAVGPEITVSKTGTYDVYWSGIRTNTSSSYTWGTQLYIGGSAYGTENTTWSSNVQNNHLTNVSLTINQKIRVYGRGRGSSYYLCAPTLVIIEA